MCEFQRGGENRIVSTNWEMGKLLNNELGIDNTIQEQDEMVKRIWEMDGIILGDEG
jgi:hypothetical protein